MSTHEDREAEKRPLRWMKPFLIALIVGGVVLVVSWLRAPSGDAPTPMGTEPARTSAPAAK